MKMENGKSKGKSKGKYIGFVLWSVLNAIFLCINYLTIGILWPLTNKVELIFVLMLTMGVMGGCIAATKSVIYNMTFLDGQEEFDAKQSQYLDQLPEDQK
jgi:uncharacterized membrane protein YiaA